MVIAAYKAAVSLPSGEFSMDQDEKEFCYGKDTVFLKTIIIMQLHKQIISYQ